MKEKEYLCVAANDSYVIWPPPANIPIKTEPDELQILLEKVAAARKAIEYAEMMAIRVPTLRARPEVRIEYVVED